MVYVFCSDSERVSYMVVRKIKLTDTEDVREFVASAGKCDFDCVMCHIIGMLTKTAFAEKAVFVI